MSRFNLKNLMPKKNIVEEPNVPALTPEQERIAELHEHLAWLEKNGFTRSNQIEAELGDLQK